MPLPFVAAAIGASGIISAIIGNKAADKASDASQYATDQNTALQRELLAAQQANTATSRAVGDSALLKLAERFGLSPQAVASTANSLGVPVEGQYAQQSSGGGISPEYLTNNPDLVAEGQKNIANGTFQNMEQYLNWRDQNGYANEGRGDWRLPVTQPAAQDPDAIRSTPLPQELVITQPRPAGVTSAADIDKDGFYTGARPTVGDAPTYTAPVYRETSIAPLDVSIGNYQQSPDYNFQLEEGNKNILANASATGGLESGAALKALQSFGQNLAMGDYGQWRDYATGQYNNDRGFAANRDDAYNSFGQSTALAKFGADQSNYQYGTNLNQSIYNTNRDYATNRYDTSTNALMGLAGYGQNATNSNNSALASSAANQGNAYFANATNQGNAALSAAGQVGNLIGNGANALAYYYGRNPAGAAAGGGAGGAYAYDPATNGAYEGLY